MADPAVLPLPSCNQLMATNLWGLENAVKAVISGEGPQQCASWQSRMLGTDLVARGDSLQLGLLGRERGEQPDLCLGKSDVQPAQNRERGHRPIDGSRDSGSSEGQQPLASMATVLMEQKEAKSLFLLTQAVPVAEDRMGAPRTQPCWHSRSLQTGPP